VKLLTDILIWIAMFFCAVQFVRMADDIHAIRNALVEEVNIRVKMLNVEKINFEQ
jgi:hypothetical protein